MGGSWKAGGTDPAVLRVLGAEKATGRASRELGSAAPPPWPSCKLRYRLCIGAEDGVPRGEEPTAGVGNHGNGPEPILTAHKPGGRQIPCPDHANQGLPGPR